MLNIFYWPLYPAGLHLEQLKLIEAGLRTVGDQRWKAVFQISMYLHSDGGPHVTWREGLQGRGSERRPLAGWVLRFVLNTK